MAMTPMPHDVASVRKQIEAGRPDPIYLIHGDDEIEKSALAAAFTGLVDEALRDFNVEKFHGSDMATADRLTEGVATLVAAARTLPMMSPRRVITVLQAEWLIAPKRESEAAARALEQLEQLFNNPEPYTTLVLVASNVDKRSRLYKLLAKQATLVECGVLGNRADAERWVRNRVAAAGQDIDPAAAGLLATRAGTDVKRLRADVDRLLLVCTRSGTNHRRRRPRGHGTGSAARRMGHRERHRIWSDRARRSGSSE